MNNPPESSARQPNSQASFGQRLRPGLVMGILIAGIALAEVIAMYLITFARGWPYLAQVLLDAAIMVVIIFPMLYFLSLKPLLGQIDQRRQSEAILQSRLRLAQFADQHELADLLQMIMDELERLTGSTLGSFHLFDEGTARLRRRAWSSNTLDLIRTAGGDAVQSALLSSSAWGDATCARAPIIHNSPGASAPATLAPATLAPAILQRELVVPIVRGESVLACIHLANKAQEYTQADVDKVADYLNFAWGIVEHIQAQDALIKSEEKFRLFMDWTYDWELWLDPAGNVIQSTLSCERITGYRPADFHADPNLLLRITHPDDRAHYLEHLSSVHDALAGPVRLEYRILACDDSVHWIEHICRPLFTSEGRYLGRRVSNREVTDQKLDAEKIDEHNRREQILNQALRTIQTDIARDLHDSLGQNIAYVRMILEHLLETQLKEPEQAKNQIQSITRATQESYDQVRTMLSVLQAGDTSDPINLFARYAAQISERSRIAIEVASQGSVKTLTPHQIRQVFYIFRETLSNIEKYSGAAQAWTEFRWGDHGLTLCVTDNGRGFDPHASFSPGHFGIKFMRERAELLGGSFSIESASAEGTKITVFVPYE